jgi:hypothetical protein
LLYLNAPFYPLTCQIFHCIKRFASFEVIGNFEICNTLHFKRLAKRMCKTQNGPILRTRGSTCIHVHWILFCHKCSMYCSDKSFILMIPSIFPTFPKYYSILLPLYMRKFWGSCFYTILWYRILVVYSVLLVLWKPLFIKHNFPSWKSAQGNLIYIIVISAVCIWCLINRSYNC